MTNIKSHKHCECGRIIQIDKQYCTKCQNQCDVIGYQLFGTKGEYIKKLEKKYGPKYGYLRSD